MIRGVANEETIPAGQLSAELSSSAMRVIIAVVVRVALTVDECVDNTFPAGRAEAQAAVEADVAKWRAIYDGAIASLCID